MNKALPLVMTLAIVTTFTLTLDRANASTSFTGSSAGTFVSVPLDLDNDSCTSVSGVTVCSDLSGYNTGFGTITSTGAINGSYSGQSVDEAAPVAGTGCSINPTGQQSCTLGAATDACAYSWEAGSGVAQKSGTTSLLIASVTPGGSLCINFNSAGGFALPYNYSNKLTVKITGATGTLKGITGSFTQTTTGQILGNDLQGHEFGWFSATQSGTTNP